MAATCTHRACECGFPRVAGCLWRVTSSRPIVHCSGRVTSVERSGAGSQGANVPLEMRTHNRLIEGGGSTIRRRRRNLGGDCLERCKALGDAVVPG